MAKTGLLQVMADKVCVDAMGMAQSVMQHRQNGFPLSFFAKLMQDNKAPNAKTRRVVEDIIFEAYQAPIEEKFEDRNKVARECGNEMHIKCMISNR